jgi:hypothetical protein
VATNDSSFSRNMLAWPVQTSLYRLNICFQLIYVDSQFFAHSFALCLLLVGTVGALLSVGDISGSDDALRDIVPDILRIHDQDDDFFNHRTCFFSCACRKKT